MAFRNLLRGSSGEPRGPVPVADRARASKPDSAPAALSPTPAGRINVLYLAADASEARFVSGTFTHAHPHLHLDVINDRHEARTRVRERGRYDALVVGWSVPEDDGIALIAHAKEQNHPVAVIAAGEQSLDRYSEAGADKCVQKGGSFLARLPIAIDEAVKARKTTPPVLSSSKPLRVAYAGDIERIKADLGGDGGIRIQALQQALRDADTAERAAALDVDAFVIDHDPVDGKSAAALADVRARNLDLPIVLLVNVADESAAHQRFGTTVDDYLTKTPGWAPRLAVRLGPILARHAQFQELAALRVKEARLRSMVDRLPASVLRLSSEGTILATNAIAMAMLGAQAPGALVRKPFESLVVPRDRQAWNDFLSHLSEGEHRSVEVSITTLAGTSRVMEAAAMPVPAELGRETSLLMVLRDLTERKRLEASVVETAEAALAADHATPPAAPSSDGPPLRDLEGDLHRVATTARTALADFGSMLRDVEARHDAAFTRWVDESARIKASQLEQWRSYDTFFQNAYHGMCRVSLTGTLIACNHAFARILGYDSPDDLLAAGQSLDALVEGDRWHAAADGWRRGDPAEAVELKWRRKDRSLLTLRLHGRLVAAAQDAAECFEVIAEDIAAPRMMEQQLRRARRWEDAARITSGIAADLVHVLAGLDQSRVHGSSHSTPAEQQVLEQAAKALALSRQLVAYGRREARDPSALDLNSVVRGMEPVIRRLLDEHIDLTIDLEPDPGVAHAAQPVVEEALVSLAVAARDVLPAGGRIAIGTSALELDDWTAGQHGVVAGAYVLVSLTVTGWGMEAAVQERLTAGTADGDAGRRVANVSRALAHAGGGLRVEGVAEQSLTFTVYLPVTGGAAAVDGETPVQLP